MNGNGNYETINFTIHNGKVEFTPMNDNLDGNVAEITLGGFSTRTMSTARGYIGQIVSGRIATNQRPGGSNYVVFDTEPFETIDEAMTAANDKLKEKLKSIFAS